eukprot:6970483-Prymnesium_polylepis.1
MRSIVSASCSAATHCSQAARLTCMCIARTAAVSVAACAPPLPLRTGGGAWGGRSPPLLGGYDVTAARRVGSVLSHLSVP